MSDFGMFFENDEPNTHEFNDEMRAFCSALNDWLKEHEASVHDGQICDEERGNALAFIIHSMGYENLQLVLETMVDRLAYYIERHQHHGNGNGGHSA